MRVATKEDREKVIDILYRAYKDNPSFLWIVKNGPDAVFQERIKKLCAFCFDVIQPIGGVYITTPGNGVCMIYNINDKRETLHFWWLQIKLAFNVIGLTRALEILKRENHIQKIRPKRDYLYFWMLAVDPDVKGFRDMQEMRDSTYKMSEDQNLPIYAETTVDKNKIMYSRYGFREYHHWPVPGKDVNIYFMKREPGTVEERNKKSQPQKTESQ